MIHLKNFLNKREQSQARLSFAECEKSRLLARTLLTLVALFAMTAGAWADGVKIKFAANGKEKVVTVESLPHTFWCKNDNASDELDLILQELYDWPNDNGDNYYCYIYDPYPSASGNDKVTAGIDGINHYVTIAEGFEGSATVTGKYQILGGVATYELAISPAPPAGTALKPDATRKVWTLDAMPAGNVELQVAYFPGMLTLAQADGGTIAVDGLSLGGPKAFDVPAAWSSDETTFSANDLPTDFAAIDDADLPATIAALSSDAGAFLIYGFAGEKTKIAAYVNGTKDDTDASKYTRANVSSWIEGGMKIYYTAAPTLPAGFDTDGTNIYVEPKTQFKVKAVPATGYHLVSLSDGTNTYDVDADGIATVTMPEGDADLTLTATFSDEFELTFDDVNFKTNANITVKVGDAEKTLDQDGKLSVKSGQTVTLTAKQGYKFHSVEAKKAGEPAATFVTGAVNANNLKVGDILKDVTSISGTGYFTLAENRYKQNGTKQPYGAALEVGQIKTFSGYTITTTWDAVMTPIDDKGQDGNAWIVTGNDGNGPVVAGYTVTGN